MCHPVSCRQTGLCVILYPADRQVCVSSCILQIDRSACHPVSCRQTGLQPASLHTGLLRLGPFFSSLTEESANLCPPSPPHPLPFSLSYYSSLSPLLLSFSIPLSISGLLSQALCKKAVGQVVQARKAEPRGSQPIREQFWWGETEPVGFAQSSDLYPGVWPAGRHGCRLPYEAASMGGSLSWPLSLLPMVTVSSKC